MWQSYFNGLLVTAGLIVAIGAQNAFVLAQSLRREHHLPVAALCILCDILLVSVGVFGLAAVLAENPLLLKITRWGGVLFLLFYGVIRLSALLVFSHVFRAANQPPCLLGFPIIAAFISYQSRVRTEI